MTRTMIAENGAQNLSLRSVARYCGMSAPGLLHHFSSLEELLTAVLEQRAEEHALAIQARLADEHPDPTLRNLADTVVRFYADEPEEARNFDRLEGEAFSPGHPARKFFKRSTVSPWDVTLNLIEKEYRDPEAVLLILSLVVDGLRLRWLRDEDADYWTDWVGVRDAVFATFETL